MAPRKRKSKLGKNLPLKKVKFDCDEVQVVEESAEVADDVVNESVEVADDVVNEKDEAKEVEEIIVLARSNTTGETTAPADTDISSIKIMSVKSIAPECLPGTSKDVNKCILTDYFPKPKSIAPECLPGTSKKVGKCVLTNYFTKPCSKSHIFQKFVPCKISKNVYIPESKNVYIRKSENVYIPECKYVPECKNVYVPECIDLVDPLPKVVEVRGGVSMTEDSERENKVSDNCQSPSNVVQKKTLDERIKLATNNTRTACFLVGRGKDMIVERKSLFYAASNVFEAMFNGPLKEGNVIEIEDVETNAFKTLIEFLKTRTARFSNTYHASCVLYVAEKYDFSALKNECVQYLYPSSLDDLWIALETGVQYNITSLIEGSIAIVRKETLNVFNSRQFLYLPQEALAVIIKDPYLAVDSEVEVLDAAVNWARFQCLEKGNPVNPENMRNVLGNIVFSFKFLTLDEVEIQKWAGLILPPNELRVLLELVNDRDAHNPDLPFSICVAKRRKHFTLTNIPQGPLISAQYNPSSADTFFAKLSISTTTFSVIQTIRLISVSIWSRIKTFRTKKSFYCEDLNVNVKTSKNEVIGVGHFRGRVQYNEKIEIFVYDVACTKKRAVWLRAPVTCGTQSSGNNRSVHLEYDGTVGLNYDVEVVFNKRDGEGFYPCHNLKFSHDVISCYDVSRPVIIGLTYSKM